MEKTTLYALFQILPCGVFFPARISPLLLSGSLKSKFTCENNPTVTSSSTHLSKLYSQSWGQAATETIITWAQRIISKQAEGIRVFSRRIMNTSLLEAYEPSQEKLIAAVKFLILLWVLISQSGVSILFYKEKWVVGFFFMIGPDPLLLELLGWGQLDTLQLLISGRKEISFCNKILPMVILKT